MRLKNYLRSHFSKLSLSKSYDIVFVGPLASRLSHQIYRSHGHKFICLNINSQSGHLEHTLYPFNTNPIPISSIVPSQFQSINNSVAQILPQSNALILNDQSKVHYNQLVFTSNNHPDFDRYQGLKQALNEQCGNVFVNDGSNLNNLKQLSVGNLVFSVPAGRHTGEDNYQFLSINHFIQTKLKSSKESALKVQTYLILEDGNIFKFSKELNEFVKQLCRSNQITLLENQRVVRVDSVNRELILSSGQRIPYSGYYQYMPLKDSLPGAINPQTLSHQKYSNIFMFGNAQVPTTHSFGAKNYQLRVVKENLINNLLGIKKLGIYDGTTILPILSDSNKAIYFTHSYNKKIRSFGKFGPWNVALAKMQEWFGPTQVKNYYRFVTYGYPYYFRNKGIKTVTTSKTQVTNKTEAEIPPQYLLDRKKQV